MFLTNKQYLLSVKSLLTQSSTVDIAVAFWGQGAEFLIAPQGKTLRIICNLAMGGTNPEVIRTLRTYACVEIKNHDRLHAKVLLGDQQGIVGSANCSANGLNYEGNELLGWHEAGYRVDDPAQLQQMQAWFDTRWAEAHPITDTMLNEAAQLWRQRSHTRRFKSASQLLQMPAEDLARRDAAVLIWREPISEQAEKYFEAIKSNAANPELTDAWGVYEDWFDNLHVGQTIIDIRIGARGGVDVSGLFEIIDQQTFCPEGSDEEMSVHISRKVDSLLDIPEKQLLHGLKAQVKRHWRERLVLESGDVTQVLSLPDFVKALQPN